MKRISKSIISALAALCIVSISVAPSYAVGVTAVPTASTVMIDNETVAFEAYTIGGNNYFKLRDVAAALLSTPIHFSVDWDGASNAIALSKSGYYVPQGGELKVSGDASVVQAIPCSSKITLNGEKTLLTAYTIKENNYFKLRDIGAAIDFGVNYDETTNTIKINTTAGYLVSGILDVLDGAYYAGAANVISYTGTDTGSIQVNFPESTYYIIDAMNISSDKDFEKLRDVLALFISTPDQVITELKASGTEGRKELQIDGKKLTCFSSGMNQTVTIMW